MGFYIPKTLEKFNNWVLWKLEDGKKKPFSAKYNGLASVAKPFQWASYGAAIAKLKYTDEYNGLGFVFSKNCGLVFIDLDNCIDEESGELSSFASDIIKLFKGNYIEYSQSGRGLHIICKGTIPAAHKSAEIELYNSLRYMAFTGNAYEANEPQPAQEALNLLCKRFNITEKQTAAQIEPQPATADDKSIIAKAERGGNASDFKRLYAGEWQYKYTSQSQADLRLVCILWYYSRNAEQVKRIFLLSGLGQREKATKREDYIQRLIATAAQNMPAEKEKQAQALNRANSYTRQATEPQRIEHKRRSYWKD